MQTLLSPLPVLIDTPPDDHSLSTRLDEVVEQLRCAQLELAEGTALTTCPDCGSHSASSTEARANKRILELERQNKSLELKLLAVDEVLEGLWLYPVENFPSGDAAVDMKLFADHMQAFTAQVQQKMATLAASLEKLTARPSTGAPGN